MLKGAPYPGAVLVTSDEVLTEAFRVLAAKFPARGQVLGDFVRSAGFEVIQHGGYAALVPRQECRDAEDRHVLAAAKAGKCSFIVTGDKDLLSLKKSAGIRIVTTSACLRML